MTNDKYKATQAEDGLWGVEDERGAILYEADIATEAQARFMAQYHTDHPDAEFERDVWPAWVEHLAKTDPYESALLFVETAPQDELINVIIEHRKLNKRETKELKPLHKCWTIWQEKLDDGSNLATIGRPQDWGDPKWMYREYALEAHGYRNIVHCWTDAQLNEHEHLQLFAGLIAQIMLPGWPEHKSGNEYLDVDDFWDKSWGKMPPVFESAEDDWEM